MTMGMQTQMSSGGGNFTPIIKYYSDAGRFFEVNRVPNTEGGFNAIETELGQGTTFAMDFGSVEVGWALLAKGMAPSWAMVPFGQPKGPPPSPDHRDGFRIKIWNQHLGVREFAATAVTIKSAVDELHTLFEMAPEAQRGLVPVVRFSGILPIVVDGGQRGKKTYFRPILEIVNWTQRIPELGERTVAIPRAGGVAAAQAPAVQQVAQSAVQQPWQQQNQPQPANPRHVGAPAPAARAVDEWGSAAAIPMHASGAGGALQDDEIPF
jgi:hypothetical protein